MPNQRARQSRQFSTDAERRIWSALRDRRLSRYKFRRQHPIGRYVVDFVCIEHRLAIELDGGQHATDPQDPSRTDWLERQGWQVIRFWNNDVLSNTGAVLETILRAVRSR
jgi:very-short-patch-repair endonuclease